MIVRPGTMRLKRSLANKIAMMFANGLDGFWYDPLLPYLYDTSTGVARVDAAEDPVGLYIDRRLGAGLGAELVTNGGFDTDTAWTKTSNWTISGGVAQFSPATATNDILFELNKVVVGKAYRITFDLVRTTGSLAIYAGSSGAGIIYSSSGSYSQIIIASGNTTLYIYALAGFTGYVDNISVKLLDGNHALQATAAARPTYRVDAGGRPYVAWLGTDDNMTSATGGGGSAGFFYCAAIKPTGGAGTLRTLWSDTGTNTGYKVQIDAANKLSFSAGNGAAFTTLASTATLSVGTNYVVTVWDDGTNLNVQINTAAAETVARPVVVAGTAGYTVGKDNGAASSYRITDVYFENGAKNTGLTSSQRNTIQTYARSRIGL